ncbi:hypothetical protein BC833DRAFT_612427 [Globomyces pollinis-pini]|nr:hypothetical protein BC833DRAFT_612427 [Globomyces pollinis-pini]
MDVDAKTSPKLIQILDELEKRKLLSLVEIIQLLSKNPQVTLGMIRPYLMKSMQQDLGQISKSRALIDKYLEETDAIHTTIQELETKPITFQSSICELCRQHLELPSIYFLCKHSYHSKCLGDMAHECPRCGPEHRIIQEMIKTQKANASKHELFQSKIADAGSDPFPTMIEYFSKNLF